MEEKKELQLYSCTYIMDTTLNRNQFIVEKMLYPGLYILAGAPKVGKSWLALDLCLSVANGQQFLKHETAKGQVVYLALEDSLLRLQNRMYEFTDEPTDNLDFAILANSIGNGLEEQLENTKQKLPNLKLIVIDTLQMIRESIDINYGSDYRELSVLKSLADSLEVAIVLVHHTRKNYDADPFNMISGTTGISGCVDGSFVLMENKRGSRVGKLFCVGRDIENMELNVKFEKYHWVVTDSVAPYKRDIFSFAIHDMMIDEISFRGSATELCKLLFKKYGEQFYPNRVTRDLVQHSTELADLGVMFRSRRSHGCRIIEQKSVAIGDSFPQQSMVSLSVDKEVILVNIIRELYHGNIAPSECCYKSGSKFSKLGLKWLELHDEFVKGLTEQQREQFNQLTDIQGQQTSVATEESYVQGFRDGARMALDMLSGDDKVLK